MWVLLLLMVAMVLGEDPTLSSDDGDARPSRYQHFEYSEELAQLALVRGQVLCVPSTEKCSY